MGRSAGWGRRVEASILLSLAWPVRWISPAAQVRLGRVIGRLAYHLDRGHRRLAARNLIAALGCTPSEAERLTLATFAHFGRVIIEVLALPRTLHQPERITIEGWEHLERAHAQGRGVLLYSAHIGNWELGAQQQALRGIPTDFIARPLDNPWIDEAFARWREQAGNRVVVKRGALRQALKTLRAGRALAILIDQHQRIPPRLFVPFFARLAATTPTLGVLAVRTGAPVVPVVTIPHPDGRYTMRYEPPLEIPDRGDDESRADAVTLAATRTLERWIREHPASWLWLHDRWKSTPEPDERVLA